MNKRRAEFNCCLGIQSVVKIKISYYKGSIQRETSGQDGGIGRYTVPPHTTKRRTTTNLKTKSNQNYQKIELYGSLTIKELKNKHSSRLLGGVETGSQGGEDSLQGSSWQSRQSNICMWINWEEQLESETDCATQGSSIGNKASKPLTKKPMGVEVAGETTSLTGEFTGETYRVLQHTQNNPPRNQHQKGPVCLWVAGEVSERQLRAEQVALFPLEPLPSIQHHNTATWVAPP